MNIGEKRHNRWCCNFVNGMDVNKNVQGMCERLIPIWVMLLWCIIAPNYKWKIGNCYVQLQTIDGFTCVQNNINIFFFFQEKNSLLLFFSLFPSIIVHLLCQLNFMCFSFFFSSSLVFSQFLHCQFIDLALIVQFNRFENRFLHKII